MNETVNTQLPVSQGVVTNSNTGKNWIMLIYFCSGLCSLIDEVVWVRLLKLTLGNTVYASSIVVSMFMGGLALGALIMSRYADKIKRPLRLYAALEVIATISALLMPYLLRVADIAYRWYFAKYLPSPTELLLVQIIVSAMLLLVPATVMGSTLPLLGRYLTTLQQQVGRLVGRLYALNTFGAAMGCFLAGFVLIRAAGVMGTLYIAAVINLFVALGGWVLSRSYDATEEVLPERPVPEAKSATITRPAEHKQYVLMAAFFFSGLISISYELIWMRSVTFLLGGFTYVFSAVLTIYLLGNVIGAWLGSRLSKRLKNPSVGFGVSLTCLGLLGILYIPWMNTSNWLTRNVMPLFGGLLEIHGAKVMFWPMFYSTFLFLLPATTMGIGFPLALQAWSNYRHKVGQTAGTVYAVNTIGAVLGGILAGFLLIPVFGVQLSITILGLAGIWIGLIMVQLFAVNIVVIQRISYLIIAVGLTIGAARIPTNLFEKQFVKKENTWLLALNEGVTTTVSVHQDAKRYRTLRASGIQVAGDAKGVFRVPQKVLGHLGIFLNKNARSVLSVGFGSGETTACMSQHNLNHIECVEISPELVEISLEYFKHINLGDRLDKKIKMVYMDAKNYLHLTPSRYDLIVNDCINPRQFADNASLYTKEYLQDALDHLNPGGIFGTYLPVTEMPISCTNSILGTISEVFPYVTIWFPITAPSAYDFWYIAGSKEPQLFSPKYIEEQMQSEEIKDSVSFINFLDSQYVLSCYVGDQDDLKRYLEKYNLNSDYRPFVEFTTDENETVSAKREWFAQFLKKVRRDGILEHIDWAGMSKDQQEKWTQKHKLFYKASTHLFASRVERNPLNLLQNDFEGLRLLPEHPAFLEQEHQSLSKLSGALGKMLPTDYAIMAIDKILAKQPDLGTAWLVRSWALNMEKKMDQSLIAAKKAVKYSPNTLGAQNNLGVILSTQNRTGEAIAHYRKAVQLMPNEAILHFNLGVALSLQNNVDEAILHVRKSKQLLSPYISVKAYCFLGDLLSKKGQKEMAIEEYRKALSVDPHSTLATDKLKAAMAQ